jgi:hypothetical protein
MRPGTVLEPEWSPAPGFHLPGIVAYAAGALTAWFTGTVCPFFIPALNGIAIAAAVYVLLTNGAFARGTANANGRGKM